MGHEPRPADPRRLSLLNSVSAGYGDDGLLRVTVTFTYDEWCCGGLHEVADALEGIHNLLEEAQTRLESADRERLRRDLGLD